MVAITFTRRGDEQLETILFEAATWAVNGVQGMVLCEVASLGPAIEKAAEFAARGREVVAVVRRSLPEIAVSSGQRRKLASLLPESRNLQALYELGHANRVSVVPLNDSDGALIAFEGPRRVYQRNKGIGRGMWRP